MSFLCVLAAIAGFVVESKSIVSTTGEQPEGAKAVYECTYKKGQLTAGNMATLSLSNWQNITISRITLFMHSNQASGAGSLVVKADGQIVWEIANSSFDTWTDSGYSKTTVSVSQTFFPSLSLSFGEISLCIAASENSLYIERYEIEWQPAQARPYTVTFIDDGSSVYSQVSEPSVGEGVLLPALPDIGAWYFAGWSEQSVEETVVCPMLLAAGTRYFPAYDICLYAVYRDYLSSEVSTTQCVEPNSGYYAIAFPLADKVMCGVVEQELYGVPLMDASLRATENGLYERLFEITPTMAYAVHFLNDTLVQIWHAESGERVGYKNGKLYADSFDWHYRLLPDSTFAFYVPQDSISSHVMTPMYDAQTQEWVCRCTTYHNATLCCQALLYATDFTTAPVHYTSYPYGQAIEQPEQSSAREELMIVQMGIYRLHIMPDGKKRLSL